MTTVRRIDKNRRFTMPPGLFELLNVTPGKDKVSLTLNGRCLNIHKFTQGDFKSGYIRSVDYKGRFIIPKEICEFLKIKPEIDILQLKISNDSIQLSKAINSCIFCHQPDSLFVKHNGLLICIECARSISNKLRLLDD